MSSIKINKSNVGNILYVGGTGAGNFSKIQDAIDNTSAGDTVFVYDDSSPYYQTVLINKKINLVGENKLTTIIHRNGTGDIVKISVSYVNLSGFTIWNSNQQPHGTGVDIFNQLKYVNVFDNIILSCYQGIDNYDNSYIKIYNNVFLENRDGIDFLYGKHCSVYNNLFLNNSIGLNAFGPGGRSNIIFSNEFRENNDGIYFLHYKNATIHSNNFINNTKHAFYVNDRVIFFNIFNKQEWYNNYWDDCNNRFVKVIVGEGRGILYFYFGITYPVYDFDWFPAREPYDISIPEVYIKSLSSINSKYLLTCVS